MSFNWATFFHYVSPATVFTDPLLRDGLLYTIVIALGGQVGSTLLGLVGAAGRLSRWRLCRVLALVYITYFRGTPIIVQLSLIYFGSAALGIYGFADFSIGSFVIPGAVQAGAVTISLCDGAYMTEIIRAGIISVDRGQIEAGRALGLRGWAIQWRIVFPQAARIIIPPYGNHFNAVIKSTAIVITIGGLELFGSYSQTNAKLFQPFELFLACSFYYLALTVIWTLVLRLIERHYADETNTPTRPSASMRRRDAGRRSRLAALVERSAIDPVSANDPLSDTAVVR